MAGGTVVYPAVVAGRRRRAAAVCLALSLLAFFVLLALAGAGDAPAGLDRDAKATAESLRAAVLTPLVTAVTHLGSWPAVTAATALVAGLLVARGRWRGAVFLAGTMAAGIGAYVAVKHIVERARPDAADAVASVGGWAFPSGHATQAAAFAAALTVIAWPTRRRVPVALGATAFAALVGLSRVYLGVHWLSDVLAGWALGVAVACAVLLVVEAVAGPITDERRGSTIDVILLDWGNTLMEDRGLPGPMADWPEVAAVAGAHEALRRLRPHYRLVVATNADSSGAAQVRAALARVGLDELIDDVVSSRDVGACKPDASFYRAALARSGTVLAGGSSEAPPVDPSRVVMVGDSYENDVAGALAAGLRAVWLDPGRRRSPPDAPPPTARIVAMSELPGVVAKLAGARRDRVAAPASAREAHGRGAVSS